MNFVLREQVLDSDRRIRSKKISQEPSQAVSKAATCPRYSASSPEKRAGVGLSRSSTPS